MKDAEEIVKAGIPDALDEHDMGYHVHLAKRRQNDAQRLIQQRDEALKGLQDLQGATVSWGAYLQEKYGLAEGDRVEEDGRILRKETPE